MEIEYFCPGCKKFVKTFRTVTGALALPGFPGAAGEMPVKVCDKCDTPVLEFTKPKSNKTKTNKKSNKSKKTKKDL